MSAILKFVGTLSSYRCFKTKDHCTVNCKNVSYLQEYGRLVSAWEVSVLQLVEAKITKRT